MVSDKIPTSTPMKVPTIGAVGIKEASVVPSNAPAGTQTAITIHTKILIDDYVGAFGMEFHKKKTNRNWHSSSDSIRDTWFMFHCMLHSC